MSKVVGTDPRVCPYIIIQSAIIGAEQESRFMENKTLHLLILEDNPDDAELAEMELKREGLLWNGQEKGKISGN